MNYKQVLKAKLHPSLYTGFRYIYAKTGANAKYAKAFRDTSQFLERSQWWTRSELEAYQMKQLTHLLRHAYENVPYYRRVFDEHGIKPMDIQSLEDFRKIPFITKEMIQENIQEMVAKNFARRKLEYITTGGSTGIPMGFYIERGATEGREKAFMFAQWRRVGYKSGDRSAVLRGSVVQGAGLGKYWEYDPIHNNLILSSYHMTDETLKQYVEKIREFKPAFIQAYPSAATILASYMRQNQVEPFESVKAILCGSENLYPWQRELLGNSFHCRIYSWYGHAEKAALAGECENSNYYHVFPEYGIFELVGSSGETIGDEGGTGEIVATGFNNYAMPLIRYRTMDLATKSNACCDCGRNYPLIKKIEGRLQELIVTGEGRFISMTAINMHSDIFDNVKQFQFLQEEKGKVILNLVKRATYTSRDDAIIREELMKKLGDEMYLKIQYKDEIPRTPSGKYRFLIQKLPVAFGD